MTWTPDDARPLAPSIRRVWLVSAVIRALFFGAAGAIAGVVLDLALQPLIVAAIAFAAALAASLAWIGQRYRRWWYTVRPDELAVGNGVLLRRRTCIPRTRIQHVDLVSGPLLRHYDLSSVAVYTAGSTSAALTIPGLPTGEAESVRSWLIGREP